MMAYTRYSSDARVIKAAETCVQLGYEVDVLALRENGYGARETVRGVRIYRLNVGKYQGGHAALYLFSYMHFLCRVLALSAVLCVRKRFRIVHVHNMPNFLVLGAAVPRLFGARLILDIHDSMPELYAAKFASRTDSPVWRLILWEQRFCCALADAIITVHEPLKAQVLVPGGIPGGKITVVTNFADERTFAFLDDYSLSAPLRVVYHGTVSERVGLREVLDAIGRLRNRAGLRLTIIGDGDFAPQLRRLIQAKKLGDSVTFHNTVYSNGELPSLLKGYHLGLAVYQRSAATEFMLPVKMLEYIALGIPCLAISNRAIPYYLNGDECFYCRVEDGEGLSAILDDIVQNPGLLLEKRERLKQARKRFLWSQEQHRYERLLAQVSLEGKP